MTTPRILRSTRASTHTHRDRNKFRHVKPRPTRALKPTYRGFVVMLPSGRKSKGDICPAIGQEASTGQAIDRASPLQFRIFGLVVSPAIPKPRAGVVPYGSTPSRSFLDYGGHQIRPTWVNCWPHLGPSLGHLGSSWRQPSLCHLGAILDSFCDILQPSWTRFGRTPKQNRIILNISPTGIELGISFSIVFGSCPVSFCDNSTDDFVFFLDPT